MSDSATVVIAGAGPAGLTAAYELSSRSSLFHPVVFEETDTVGGISRTVVHHGNRMDIGGHRFFSKSRRVMDWWQKIMPVTEGTDFSGSDRVMMWRPRVSHILYLKRFFDYPVSLSWTTLSSLGLVRTAKSIAGFIAARCRTLPEISLENFYVNRFGRPLYNMFFEDYTCKVWGVHPSRIGAQWGAQRVKGLSVSTVVRNMLRKSFGSKTVQSQVETSLIERFIYPKYGPGQLWEAVASDAKANGAEIEMESRIEKIHVSEGRVTAVTVRLPDLSTLRMNCGYLISSMPICSLVAALEGIAVPAEVAEIAGSLPYRDFITVGLLVDRLTITPEKGGASRLIPDTWIYVQERDVRLGRIQVFNNWSPWLVADAGNKVWLGLEYFCTEGDSLWEMNDSDFAAMAASELEKLGIINTSDVRDFRRIKVRKAYPAYFGSYGRFDRVRQFLDGIQNLFCVGRNGQHRYNNMDHSMLTAMEAVDAIISGNTDHSRVWNVNTEEAYHETSDLKDTRR